MVCLSPGQLSGKKSDFPLPLPDKPENRIKYESIIANVDMVCEGSEWSRCKRYKM